jgi:hypothetical protein
MDKFKIILYVNNADTDTPCMQLQQRLPNWHLQNFSGGLPQQKAMADFYFVCQLYFETNHETNTASICLF